MCKDPPSAPSLLNFLKVNFWDCHVTITLFFNSFVLKEHILFWSGNSFYFYRQHGSGHAPKSHLSGRAKFIELSVSIILCFDPLLYMNYCDF